MERFIEKLKKNKRDDSTEKNQSSEKENIKAVNPCVACCITMGKEPHAGHMFLIAIAEQIKTGLGSKLPIVIINNNTGPRVAGTVLQIAESTGMSIKETIDRMDLGVFDLETLVVAYRSRNTEDDKTEPVMNELSKSGKDVFSVIAKETSAILKKSGFETEVLSESALNKVAVDQILNKNPTWNGSGFVPYLDNKRVVILQKSGNLTSSGSLLTSISAISDISKSDLILLVDGMPDVGNVTYVLTKTSNSIGLQIPGAGISFNGRIASGTKGEALSIKDISSRFYELRPEGNLKKAALFLTLTRPISFPASQLNLAELIYDFKDNESLISLLIKCEDERMDLLRRVESGLDQLKMKISEKTTSNDRATAKIIGYLGNRLASLKQDDIQRVLAESKKVEEVENSDDLFKFISDMGYDSSEDLYRSKRRSLGIRRNFYFSYLSNLMRTTSILSQVSQSDLNIIIQSTKICLERLGI